MDQQRWQQINKIVDTALELGEDERPGYIKKACGQNRQLHKQVTELLSSMERSGTENFLEERQAYPYRLVADFSGHSQPEPASSMIGRVIGRYKITSLIGHGGMGSVFRAERADEAYNRQVALKLMRRGMDTPANIARFKRERHILANLDHPNIARLLDGGVTGEGLPYLVMEYVEGRPLYEYCNTHKLGLPERLALFQDVCRGVRHAHRNAVIHRDLKPSNILVTEEGQVNILDFGIAKLLEPEDPASPLFQTQAGARMLTLGYAAPEQLEGAQVTTSTDAYMLGTILQELVAGVHPFELDDKTLTEIEQLIRRKSPGKPSQAFRALPADQQQRVARQRATTPGRLAKALRGDLDAIVLKALRKDPEARYTSAEKFLEDLQRREQSLPIFAREDTLRYNTSKFVNRHKTGLAVAAGFVALFIGFGSLYTWQIAKQRNRAEQEAQKSKAVSNFLTNLIKQNYPENTQGDTITVRQFLDKGYNEVQQLDKVPSEKAEILKIMGHTYRTLGQPKKAKKLISECIALLQKRNTPTKEIAHTFDVAGLIYRDLGHYQKAAKHMRKAIHLYREVGNTNTAKYAKGLRDLAYVEKILNKFDAAEKHAARAITIDKEVNGKKSSELAESYYVYASILRRQTKYQQALKYQKKSLGILQDNIKGPHPGKSSNLNNLAIIYERMGNIPKAIKLSRKSLQMNEELYGKYHPRLANSAHNIATLFISENEIDSAKYYNDYALEIAKKKLNKGHPTKMRILIQRAKIFSLEKMYNKSDSLFQKALEVANASDNNDSPLRGNLYMNWAKNATKQNQPNVAQKRYHNAFRIRKKNFGISDSLTQISLHKLITLLHDTGMDNEADSLNKFTSP